MGFESFDVLRRGLIDGRFVLKALPISFRAGEMWSLAGVVRNARRLEQDIRC